MIDQHDHDQDTPLKEKEILHRDRLEFRRLLERNGLVALVGDPYEAISWLEQMISKLADGIGRRQRLRKLLQQVKEALNREEAERQRHLNRHVTKRFRRITLER